MTKQYNSYDIEDLRQLKHDVDHIIADGGGDCREPGMAGILRAIRMSGEDSNIIVLTDASCKDCEKSQQVVDRAKKMNIKIHFFFSGLGCGLDKFPNYTYVQLATEGINVTTIESFQSLVRFISKLKQDGLSPRKRSSVQIINSFVEKCQTFNVSIFTVKFQLIVKQNNDHTKIYDPLGYTVRGQHINHDLSGYDSDEQPRNGNWTVCTVDENSIFTVTKKDLLDLAVDYYQDGHYSSAIPAAGTYLHD